MSTPTPIDIEITHLIQQLPQTIQNDFLSEPPPLSQDQLDWAAIPSNRHVVSLLVQLACLHTPTPDPIIIEILRHFQKPNEQLGSFSWLSELLLQFIASKSCDSINQLAIGLWTTFLDQ